MTSVEFIDEVVLVEARLAPDAIAEPTAFLWRGRRYNITGAGRRWQEQEGGQTWRCYLVQAGSSTYELRLNAAGGQWRLHRAWHAQYLA